MLFGEYGLLCWFMGGFMLCYCGFVMIDDVVCYVGVVKGIVLCVFNNYIDIFD